jgi:hypothetical protein
VPRPGSDARPRPGHGPPGARGQGHWQTPSLIMTRKTATEGRRVVTVVTVTTVLELELR